MTKQLPMTQTDAQRIIIDSLTALAPRLTDDLIKITADDFSDDDTDYFPARAATYSNLIRLATTYDDNFLLAIHSAITDLPDFIIDLDTADIELPITAYFIDA